MYYIIIILDVKATAKMKTKKILKKLKAGLAIIWKCLIVSYSKTICLPINHVPAEDP